MSYEEECAEWVDDNREWLEANCTGTPKGPQPNSGGQGQPPAPPPKK